MSHGEGLPGHRFENLESGIRLTPVEEQCCRIRAPEAFEFPVGRPRDARKSVARACRVACVQPLLDGKHGQAIAFDSAFAGREPDVYRCGVGMVTILCEALGAALAGAAQAADSGCFAGAQGQDYEQ